MTANSPSLQMTALSVPAALAGRPPVGSLHSVSVATSFEAARSTRYNFEVVICESQQNTFQVVRGAGDQGSTKNRPQRKDCLRP